MAPVSPAGVCDVPQKESVMSVVKTHRIQLAQRESSKVSSWITRMTRETGIERIEGPGPGNRIRIRYDLTKIRWEQIEKSLYQHHLLKRPTFLSRLTSMARRYQEQNEIDNLNTPVSPCCSDPKLNTHSAVKPK